MAEPPPEPPPEPPTDRLPPAVQPAPTVLVPRWIQLVLLPLVLVAAWGLLRAAGNVVLLFMLAGLLALLLNPFVVLLRRRRVPRGLAVMVVLGGVMALFTTAGVLLANPVADQVEAVRDAVPQIIAAADDSLDAVQRFLNRNGIDLEVKQQGETALQTLGDRLAEGSGELVAFTQEALRLLVEASIAVILVLVLAIYMLLYGERIGHGVRAIMPRGDGSPEDDYPTRIQGAVFGYVRGQLLFSLIMGTSAGLVLYVLGSIGIFPDGRTYALFFGVFFGLAELIPYVGPAIGASPPVLIALFQNPLDAVWLTLAFTALQQIEGHVVAPQVFGRSLQLNPLVVIGALLLGGQLYGFAGAFIALPIAAMARETILYLRRHLVLEPWGAPDTALAGAGSGVAVAPAPPPGGSRCPECATELAPTAAACPACGTELGESDAATAAAASGPA